MLSFIELPSFATVRDTYLDDDEKDIDPRLLKRLKEEYERG
jgi:hypothetical protein